MYIDSVCIDASLMRSSGNCIKPVIEEQSRSGEEDEAQNVHSRIILFTPSSATPLLREYALFNCFASELFSLRSFRRKAFPHPPSSSKATCPHLPMPTWTASNIKLRTFLLLRLRFLRRRPHSCFCLSELFSSSFCRKRFPHFPLSSKALSSHFLFSCNGYRFNDRFLS